MLKKVGEGEPGPECGTYWTNAACYGGGHIQKPVMNECERRECPDCAEGWVDQHVADLVWRLSIARLMGEETTDKRLIEATVRMDEDDVDGYYADRYGMNGALEDRGARGAANTGVHAPVKDGERDIHANFLVLMSHESRAPGGQGGHFELDIDDEYDISNIRSLTRMDSWSDEGAIEDMANVIRYHLEDAVWDDAADVNRDLITRYGDLHGTKLDPEAVPQKSRERLAEAIEEVVGLMPQPYEPEDDDEQRTCDHDGCNEPVFHISKAPQMENKGWSYTQKKRIMALYKWEMGLAEPPPGLKNPQTVEQFWEALDAIWHKIVGKGRDRTEARGLDRVNEEVGVT